jgi:hypothetical protein
MIKIDPKEEHNLLNKFEKVWCPHHTICAREGHEIRWCYQHCLKNVVGLNGTWLLIYSWG